MEIRVFFQKVHDVEATITKPWVVVVSQDATNGGKVGITTEVSREVAARLLVSGQARLATDAEAKRHYEEQERARIEAEQASLAGRVQIAVLSEQELRSLKSNMRQKG